MLTSPSRRSITGKARGFALLAALMTLAACGDSPTAPQSMDPDAVAEVMPAVVDARIRVATRLDDPSMRERFRVEILTLETSLAGNNVPQARISVNNIGDALNSYRASIGSASPDAADLSAIELMLSAVAPVVRNTRYEHRFKASP
jgi:hypothetical protein